MSFNGTEGEAISLETGATYTKNYRDENPTGVQSAFYGRDLLEALLAQPGSMGIRVYYGLNEDGIQELVLVSADADENDNLNLIVDKSIKCPPRCPTKNALNS
ncbi:MAG: hypothetical protein ACEQR5_02520 [Moraxellaceae bacterium]|jgi:hypothetical protein